MSAQSADMLTILLSVMKNRVFPQAPVFSLPDQNGKPSKSLICSTCLTDKDGVTVKASGAVKPKENAEQMMRYLRMRP